MNIYVHTMFSYNERFFYDFNMYYIYISRTFKFKILGICIFIYIIRMPLTSLNT